VFEQSVRVTDCGDTTKAVVVLAGPTTLLALTVVLVPAASTTAIVVALAQVPFDVTVKRSPLLPRICGLTVKAEGLEIE